MKDRLRQLALRAVAAALPPSRPLDHPPRRFLLIRPDHLGDVLLTSPAVAALREALPTAHIALMVGPWSLEVARRGAGVDEILTCEFPGFTRRSKRDPLEPYRLLLREARRLRRRYDTAIVLRPDHWWGALLAAVAGIPVRLGYDTPTTRPFLTEALPLPTRTHAVLLNLALAARAAGGSGGPAADAQPGFCLTAEDRAWATGLVESSDRPLVLLHPGSGSPLKNWPAERWAAVADALVEHGARVALTGGPDDADGPRAVAVAMRHEPLLLAGATTLGQLGALAERCALAVGTDNGPLHLAAALGTPTVRLYGPTDEAIFGPWGQPERHTALTHPLACRPCGNLVSPPCGARREPACLLGIRTEDVIRAVLNQLRDLPPSPPSLQGRGPGPLPCREEGEGE